MMRKTLAVRHATSPDGYLWMLAATRQRMSAPVELNSLLMPLALVAFASAELYGLLTIGSRI